MRGPLGRKRTAELAMSSAGLAVFVLLGFLIPVPILAWLDRPRRRD